MKKFEQAGFTLVEIAIVLVIVGLLIAAVLKGQEMITQGKIKGAISDFNGVLTAYNGYQDRYKAIPGDDKTAGDRWTSTGLGITAYNGNGDGIIQGTYGAAAAVPPAATAESNFFWQDLRLANFYAGANTGVEGLSQPANGLGGVMGVENGPGSAAGIGMSGLLLCSTGMPGKIAIAVDAQIDDGSATAGSVRSIVVSSGTAYPSISTTAPTAYSESGQYVMCRSVT